MSLASHKPTSSMSSRHFDAALSLLAAPQKSAALCLVSLALAAGCSANAEIPEVTVTQSAVAFEGVPQIPGVTDVSRRVTTTFDHPDDFELPEDLNPELHPISSSITANGAMQDLSFLEGLTLTLASRAPGAPPPQVLATYERTTSSGVGPFVSLETDTDSDVLSYWNTDGAYYEVTLWGVMPSQDWAIDVTFAFSGKISVSTSD